MSIKDRAREFCKRLQAEHDGSPLEDRPQGSDDFEVFMVQKFADFATIEREAAAKQEQKRIADLIVQLTANVDSIVEMRHRINTILGDLHSRRHELGGKNL